MCLSAMTTSQTGLEYLSQSLHKRQMPNPDYFHYSDKAIIVAKSYTRPLFGLVSREASLKSRCTWDRSKYCRYMSPEVAGQQPWIQDHILHVRIEK